MQSTVRNNFLHKLSYIRLTKIGQNREKTKKLRKKHYSFLKFLNQILKKKSALYIQQKNDS